MPPVATPIGGGSTTASANTLTFSITLTAGALVGNAVLVSATERHLSSAPTNPTVTDSRGNTYTRHEFGGLATAPLAAFYSNIATALQVGDTITITFASNNADEIILIADTVAGYSVTPAVQGSVLSMGSATTHAYGVAAGSAVDFMYGADTLSGGAASAYSSISGSTFVQVKGSPASRAIVSFYNNPGTTATQTTTVTWTSAHAGSMNNREFVTHVVTAPGAAGTSGSGTLTTTGSAPSVSADVGLSGSGTLSTGITGGLVLTGSVGTSGSGTVGTTGAPATAASVPLSGSGADSLTAVANPAQGLGTSGSGTVAVAASAMTARTNQHPTGDGAMTATGVVNYNGAAAISGSGTLSAAGRVTGSGSALGGSGALTTAAIVGLTGAVAFTGAGAVTPAGSPALNGAAALSGTGTVTLRPKFTQRPSGGLTARPYTGTVTRP